MPPQLAHQRPPTHDAEVPVIIPVDFEARKSQPRWVKFVLAGLVLFSLALAVLVWSQLLRSAP